MILTRPIVAQTAKHDRFKEPEYWGENQ